MEWEFQTPQAERNRVLEAVLLHAEQEAEHRVNNPAAKRNDPQALDLQRKHYQNIIAAYRTTKGLTPAERKTLRFVRHALRKIIALQNPGSLNAILYNRIINWLVNSLLGRQQNYGSHNKILAAYEKSTALEVNAAVLQQSMKEAGFRNHLEGPLKKMLAHNLPEFSLRYFDIQKPDTDYVLHFKKLPGTDAYYFEKFDATHRPDLPSIIRNEPSPSTLTFSITDKIAFNADEARQLAADRPVEKHISGESAWVIKADNSTAGLKLVRFDLERALDDWPIKELQSDISRQALINDLNAGRERQITMYLPGDREQTLQVSLGPDPDRDNFQLVFRAKDGTLVDAHRLVEGQTAAHDLLNKMQEQYINLKNQPTVGRPLTAHY